MALKIGQPKVYDTLPVRTRTGGGGRPRSELITAVAGLAAKGKLEIEFDSDEVAEGFKEAVTKVQAKISLASGKSLPFRCRVDADADMGEHGGVTIYRLSGEDEAKANERVRKMRETRAAKKQSK